MTKQPLVVVDTQFEPAKITPLAKKVLANEAARYTFTVRKRNAKGRFTRERNSKHR